jgi:hypothetical protein
VLQDLRAWGLVLFRDLKISEHLAGMVLVQCPATRSQLLGTHLQTGNLKFQIARYRVFRLHHNTFRRDVEGCDWGLLRANELRVVNKPGGGWGGGGGGLSRRFCEQSSVEFLAPAFQACRSR